MTRLLTIPETAERLSCHPSTVKRMLASGELTRIKVRRGTRISEVEIDALATPDTQPEPTSTVVPLRPASQRGSFRAQVEARRSA